MIIIYAAVKTRKYFILPCLLSPLSYMGCKNEDLRYYKGNFKKKKFDCLTNYVFADFFSAYLFDVQETCNIIVIENTLSY